MQQGIRKIERLFLETEEKEKEEEEEAKRTCCNMGNSDWDGEKIVSLVKIPQEDGESPSPETSKAGLVKALGGLILLWN